VFRKWAAAACSLTRSVDPGFHLSLQLEHLNMVQQTVRQLTRSVDPGLQLSLQLEHLNMVQQTVRQLTRSVDPGLQLSLQLGNLNMVQQTVCACYICRPAELATTHPMMSFSSANDMTSSLSHAKVVADRHSGQDCTLSLPTRFKTCWACFACCAEPSSGWAALLLPLDPPLVGLRAVS